MRIRSLIVENFRAVTFVELNELPDAIVIAGPNGSGKSSLFEALKLLKSAYGQYHPNEIQMWFNEAGINLKRFAADAPNILRDISRPLRVRAEIELAQDEREFLLKDGSELIRSLSLKQALGMERFEERGVFLNPTEKRALGSEVEDNIAEFQKDFDVDLKNQSFVGEVLLHADGELIIAPSPVLEVIFSTAAPNEIGIIDYHSPQRTFGRENLSGINLSTEDLSARTSQHYLYNTQQKYANVKAEMAQAYLRQLLAEKAGIAVPESNLAGTLTELFTVFFPGKKFLGPVPTPAGQLSFPILLEDGKQHDLNELSSGEKEVLLGYLRLRSGAPSNSVILLDEPELHLNPRLVRGLPRFYQRHIGNELSNQLWLVTHSDALLREALAEPAYAVFHMQPPNVSNGKNQAQRLFVNAEINAAIYDLVGDLAAYSPFSKIVIVEGGGDSKFDASVIERLFPEMLGQVEFVAGGSKRRTESVREYLENVASKAKISAAFYSVVDRDFDGVGDAPNDRQFIWDVYHLENYLLNEPIIYDVLSSLELGTSKLSERDIEDLLRASAEETVEELGSRLN